MVSMEKRPALYLHEWLAVIVFITLLLIIVLINFIHNRDLPIELGPPHHLEKQMIDATIDGAVQNPGTYSLKKGATLQELVDKGGPLPDADLKKMKMNSKIRDGRVLHVPYVKKITIYLKGEVVVQGAFEVRKGTTMEGLKDLVEFTPKADLSMLRKRKLKDGEVVRITEME